jgi:ATP-dependent HslUV protease subunit HslV
MAAARALVTHTKLDAATIVQKALEIAADICVYTNSKIKVEVLK